MTDEMAPKSPECVPDCPYRDEVLSLRQQVQLLNQQARTDALTGLFNFRHFRETLNNELERVRRTGQGMTLLLADVDHFKAFNDLYGHEMGNQLLKLIAQRIDGHLRKLDVACRYGGEEFAVLLPATSLNQARPVAERLRLAIEQARLHVEGDEPLSATISIGAACFEARQTCTPEKLIERADEQLYRAKAEGRNRVCLEPDAAPEPQSVSNEEKSALFDLLNQSSDEDSQESQ